MIKNRKWLTAGFGIILVGFLGLFLSSMFEYTVTIRQNERAVERKEVSSVVLEREGIYPAVLLAGSEALILIGSVIIPFTLDIKDNRKNKF